MKYGPAGGRERTGRDGKGRERKTEVRRRRERRNQAQNKGKEKEKIKGGQAKIMKGREGKKGKQM